MTDRACLDKRQRPRPGDGTDCQKGYQCSFPECSCPRSAIEPMAAGPARNEVVQACIEFAQRALKSRAQKWASTHNDGRADEALQCRDVVGRVLESLKSSAPPTERERIDVEEILRRCAGHHRDDALLDAPCVFCGYNGAGYWQAGTHAPGCRWRNVGGYEDRDIALQRGQPSSAPYTLAGSGVPVWAVYDWQGNLSSVQLDEGKARWIRSQMGHGDDVKVIEKRLVDNPATPSTLASSRPTEEMADAVRGILQVLRNTRGATYKQVREHCDMRGDDLSHWPAWLSESLDSYVTEQGAAMMIYEVMDAHRALASATRGSSGE